MNDINTRGRYLSQQDATIESDITQIRNMKNSSCTECDL